MQVAQALRTNQRTIRLLKGETAPDVVTVGGEKKYDIAPILVPSTLNDEIRGMDIRGIKGKPLRKLLAERDVFAILSDTGQDVALKVLTTVFEKSDQVHDVADSFLIALAGELLKSKNSLKKKKTPYGTGQKPVARPKKKGKATGQKSSFASRRTLYYKKKS